MSRTSALRMRHLRRRPIILLAVVALVAAAYGSAGNSPAATASESPAPSSAASQEPTRLTDEFSLQGEINKKITVDTSEYKKDPPWRIATITEGPINGWGITFDATMNERMKETGKFDMDKRLYIPWDYDAANQARGVEDAIAQKVDAILLTSMSRAALSASVERATEAGIPVVLCMGGVATDAYVAEISARFPEWATTARRPSPRRSAAKASSWCSTGSPGRRRRIWQTRRQGRIRRVSRDQAGGALGQLVGG